MPQLTVACRKCKTGKTSLTSYIEAQVKMVWWCDNCRSLNGVIYRFNNHTEVEIVSHFQPSHPTAVHYADPEVGEPQISQNDVADLVE